MLLLFAIETALFRLTDAYRRKDRESTVPEHTIVCVDLSVYSLAQSRSIAIDQAQRDALQTIDYKNSYPYLCKLFYLGKNDYILSIVVHHVAFDDLSWSLLENIIETTYNTGGKIQADEIVNDFDEYLKFLVDRISSRDDELSYWSKYLKDCELFINSPVTYSRHQARPFMGQRLFFVLDGVTTKRINEVCGSMHVDPVAFFLSLFALVIFNLSNHVNFGLGVSINLRREPKLKKIVGYLTNVVIFTLTHGILSKPFPVMLKHFQEWIETSVMHGTFPLVEATKLCSQQHSYCTSLVPQYLFNFISSYRKRSEPNLGVDVRTETINVETRTSKAEIMLDVHSQEQNFEYIWEYSTSHMMLCMI